MIASLTIFWFEAGGRLFRVQVKAVFTAQKEHRGYSIATSQHRLRGRATYTSEEIDFIAAYVAPYLANLFAFIPTV